MALRSGFCLCYTLCSVVAVPLVSFYLILFAPNSGVRISRYFFLCVLLGPCSIGQEKCWLLNCPCRTALFLTAEVLCPGARGFFSRGFSHWGCVGKTTSARELWNYIQGSGSRNTRPVHVVMAQTYLYPYTLY